MAPVASSSTQLANDDVPVEEIVFSCAICQATLSEVYATTEYNKGFHSGSGDDDGIVTKMWITECSHVTCGEHLENGAAPFHPKGMAPRAACPKRVRDKGDDSPKNLYSIRGLGDGEYDSAIPSEWRRCPAIKLDSSIPGMSAVRFQYTALSLYPIEVRKHWKGALRKQAAMETAYTKERKQRRQLQSELKDLKQRAKALEQAEAELKNWEKRKPMINHYLGVFPNMASDMDGMRKQLLQFGVAMPKVNYAFDPSKISALNQPQPVQTRQDNGSHTRQVNNTSIAVPHEHENSSTRKRKSEEYAEDQFHQGFSRSQRPNAASRDLMPPPLRKPRLDLQANRDMQPTYDSRIAERSLSGQQLVQVYQDNDWRPVDEHTFREQLLVQGPFSQPWNGRQVQRNLPYRSAVEINHHPQDELHGRSLHAGDAYNGEFEPQEAATIDRYSDQSPTQHFQHSRRTQHSQYYDAADYDKSVATYLPFPQQRVHHDQVTPSVQTREQPFPLQDERFRHPLQALSASDTNRQPHFASQARLPTHATPLHQTPQASRSSVASPFFREDGRAARSLPMQQPPTRGSFAQSQYDAQPCQGATVHRPMQAPNAHRRSYGRSQPSNGLSFLGRAPVRIDLRSSYAPGIRSRGTPHQYQRNTPVPQTPGNTQGLFHRPDRPPPSALHTRPPPDVNRGPVSLPVANGTRMLTASKHDEVLSQVPGVRGVTSRRGIAGFQRPDPQCSVPRDLFSSAGGTRSVLR